MTARMRGIEQLMGSGLEAARLLLGSMPDVGLVVDRDGRILYANQGAPDEPVAGTTLFEHGLPADAEARMRAALHQVFELGKPMSYEVESRGIEPGDTRWYLSRWSPIERDGEVVAALVVASDITRRVQLEHDLEHMSQVGRWEWDPATGGVKWSPALYEIYGLDPRSFSPTYESFLGLVHPDHREFVAMVTQRAYETGEPFSIDERIIRADGQERVLLTTGRAERAPDGRVTRLFGVCLDVTERTQAEQELERASLRQQAILDAAAEGIVGLDREGRVTFANPAAAGLLGVSPEALRGRAIHDIVHGRAEDPLHHPDRCPVLLPLADGLTHHAEDDLFWRPNGSPLPVQYTAAPILHRGAVTGAVLTFDDVTERKRFEARLHYLADHDPVTGLLNRRRFEHELAQHLARGRSRGLGGAVLALDLDNFKYVNDSLGHRAGDELISRVARTIRERLRDTDTLARLGGDEFAVLVPDAGIERAQEVARVLLDAVRSDTVSVAGQEIHVSASVGITTLANRADVTGEELLVEADMAMYDAKAAGRNRAALYTPMAVREAQIEARLAWVGRVRSALDADRFELWSQPIASVETGEVVQHELLVRMIEEGEVVPPGSFLPSAERFGLMPQVDSWVIAEATRMLASVDESLRLEVNVSGESMAGGEVEDALTGALAETGVDPGRLIIEVSEAAATANLEPTRRFAQHVQHLGCRFALDDVGAGFGSFYYLKHLPFDYLKIDGSLVHSLPANRTDQLVVQALVDIARGLEKQTIAEYVGDDDTLGLLRDLGVDYAQGFHVGRPEPADGLAAAR